MAKTGAATSGSETITEKERADEPLILVISGTLSIKAVVASSAAGSKQHQQVQVGHARLCSIR